MDFRYLVETKNEFNNFLSDILVPHIYNGIKGMFKYSENVYLQLEEKKKRGSNINNPGIVTIFRKTLDGISGLNNHEIEEEYSRIKNSSGFPEWFDLLIKASFKSYVLFLTWDPKAEESKYSDNKLYDSIVIKDFIHKCYIVSCSHFNDHPELFINNRGNKKEIFDILKKCLEIAMKKSLPYNNIIEEYLLIDFTKKDDNTEEIHKIKNLVNSMINNNKYGKHPNIKKIFTEESESENFKKGDKNELEDFINIELINQQKLNNQNNKNDLNNQTNLNNQNNQINLNNMNNLKQESISNTSVALTRSTMKGKEVDDIIEEASKKSVLTDNTITSETSDNNEEVDDETSESNIVLTSPPAIKKNVMNRLEDDIKEAIPKYGGYPNKNKNIEVILNKNNVPDNFDQIESYYDNLLK